ncbi:hypothetical protein GXW77_09920 [Roseomonas alkaliterrae]|uniref:Lipoprotein n=1 Tax=Neoroseomonas alkaliterrae TaxID=1452450 RepID=A0A840XR82_9PROT|nr:hypothetical protein [Neoroseomonas alkaliterrae]MBB5689189.1 hypothetical protein [Neoroseomonas alkaliterrae]MBR0676490.1 hypothetical protein [Neoroseomonas alkaliterrae]
MRLTALTALAGAALLAGCGGGSGSAGPPAPCPRVTILADGADLTQHRPGAVADLTTMTFDARLLGFQGACEYSRRRESVVVTLSAIFEVERGPAGAGVGRTTLPWFLAVTDAGDGQIIDRQEFASLVEFPPNVNRVRVQSRPVRLNFPAEERLVENHNVRLSFQLTPEQLALNRRRGPR